MKIRRTFYIIFLLSLLCSVMSFVALSSAALPYPDPTPQMLLDQAEDITLWELSLSASLLISFVSGIALYLDSRKSAKSQKNR